MSAEFTYLEGGNPPHLPGVYRRCSERTLELIAMWPVDVPVTVRNVRVVVNKWKATKPTSVLGRDDVRAACREDETS